MKVIVQRCKHASVKINGDVVGKIDKGFVLLVGFTHDDNIDIIKKVARKIVNLRIFEDENEKMNLALKDVNGKILSISQFTLYAKLDGRRPSFTDAMSYNVASNLYDLFNEELRSYDIDIKTGMFGEDMKVSLINDGPVTIIVDSKEI